jgi:hypothetical protein
MSEHAHAMLLAVALPTCVLLSGSVVLFHRERTISSLLQLVGAGGLAMVVLAHVAEAFQLLPGMHWGVEYGPGHWLDFASAVLGFTLFPLGYLFAALGRRPV